MIVLLLILVWSHISPASAQIQLPKLMGDHAVLQRGTKLDLWGQAGKGEKISLHFGNNVFETVADTEGNWEIKLPPQPAGGPFDLTFTATDTLIVKDVLFGDVFLASGQSNMELAMDRLADTYPDEIKNVNQNEIRQFEVPDEYDFQKGRTDFSSGTWKKATPENILEFSGVAYFFAKAIYQAERVPIGIINAALGGSPIAAWLDEKALKKFPDSYQEYQKWKNQHLIDSVSQHEQQATTKWHEEVDRKDRGIKENWVKTNTDRSSWGRVEIPDLIPGRNSTNSAGATWYSKKINLSRRPLSDTARLELGRLIDLDYAYINGKLVGHTGYQYPPRKYNFNTKILKEGENEVVVRLINNGGETGFVKDKPYRLILDQDTLDLSGLWQKKSTLHMEDAPPQTAIRWKPGGLYNAMIAPLRNTKIKGVLWYQGESDTDNPQQYAHTLPQMVNAWRTLFNQLDLPFLIVQLPNYMEKTYGPQESNWAEMREVQRQAALKIPHTDLAVTIDLGEWNDIHPLNKKEVGERLALKARQLIYNENLPSSGPTPKSFKVKNHKVFIEFDHLGSGWDFKSTGVPTGFIISEDGKTFYKAQVEVSKHNQLVVYHPKIKSPVLIRYAWADNPGEANLYNTEGLPAGPFELHITDSENPEGPKK